MLPLQFYLPMNSPCPFPQVTIAEATEAPTKKPTHVRKHLAHVN
jgi:hypothetical protein